MKRLVIIITLLCISCSQPVKPKYNRDNILKGLKILYSDPNSATTIDDYRLLLKYKSIKEN